MSLRANALANFGGQFFAAALVLVLAPAYIDALGLEAWGLVGILAMLSVWFNLLDVGLTPAISRELAARGQGNAAAARAAAGLVRCVEWIYLAVVISVISVVALAASSVATGWLNLSVLQAGPAGQALMLIGVVVGLRLYENIYRAVLTGLEELLVLNLLSSVFALLRWGGGLAFILTFGPPNVVDLFAWQAAVSALSLLVFAIVGHRHLRACRLRSAQTDPRFRRWYCGDLRARGASDPGGQDPAESNVAARRLRRIRAGRVAGGRAVAARRTSVRRPDTALRASVRSA